MDFHTFQSMYKERLEAAKCLVDQTNKCSVLVVQQFPKAGEKELLLPAVRESISNILAFVELGDLRTLEHVIAHADGWFDAIAMDSDVKYERSYQLIDYVKASVRKSKLFYYSDNTTWADSAINFIQQIENGLKDKNILMTGRGMLVTKLLNNLSDYGPRLFLLDDCENAGNLELVRASQENSTGRSCQIIDDTYNLNEIDLLIGASIKESSVNKAIAERTKTAINMYDIGIGNFPEDFIAVAEQKQSKIYRLDNRAGISSMVLALFETDHLINKTMGIVNIRDVELVAGGIMGHKGAIIVDNIHKASYIIGIADGKGRVKFTPETDKEEKDYTFVKKLLAPV